VLEHVGRSGRRGEALVVHGVVGLKVVGWCTGGWRCGLFDFGCVDGRASYDVGKPVA
jgi:hypothetical protein